MGLWSGPRPVWLAQGAWLSGPGAAEAGIIIQVNTAEDVVDADGDCSLREAILAANANAVTDGCGSGTWTGCAGCTVDIYSDSADEGGSYHGAVTADGAGQWSFAGPLVGPFATVTATSAQGGTFQF